MSNRKSYILNAFCKNKTSLQPDGQIINDINTNNMILIRKSKHSSHTFCIHIDNNYYYLSFMHIHSLTIFRYKFND